MPLLAAHLRKAFCFVEFTNTFLRFMTLPVPRLPVAAFRSSNRHLIGVEMGLFGKSKKQREELIVQARRYSRGGGGSGGRRIRGSGESST